MFLGDVIGLPLEINSWLMPIKYDMEQLLHNWIDTGNKGYMRTCKGMFTQGSVYLYDQPISNAV